MNRGVGGVRKISQGLKFLSQHFIRCGVHIFWNDSESQKYLPKSSGGGTETKIVHNSYSNGLVLSRRIIIDFFTS